MNKLVNLSGMPKAIGARSTIYNATFTGRLQIGDEVEVTDTKGNTINVARVINGANENGNNDFCQIEIVA